MRGRKGVKRKETSLVFFTAVAHFASPHARARVRQALASARAFEAYVVACWIVQQSTGRKKEDGGKTERVYGCEKRE